MPADPPDADALQRRLPVPLAQLHRRARNAKTALERHLAAHYLWEAALKLLASVAVIEYARRGPAAPDVAEPLKSLARPSLGHWWKFVRLLVPALADAGDPAFVRLRDGLLGKPRTDSPRAAGLDALLREVLEHKPGARNTVQFAELFNRLVTLRNDEVGHGAAGQRPAAFYERSAPAMLAGVAEVLDRLDVLAGRRLVHAADVRRLADGNWLVERFDLSADSVRRLESLTVAEAEAARLPRPGRLYLCGPDEADPWRSLHPLLAYDAEAERVFFLNSRAGKRRAEYLCYTTGEVVKRDELGQDQRELLIQVLGGPVDSAAVQAWAEASAAGEAPPPAGAAPSRTIGEFELISRLGRGGMGVVYRAWQPSLGRQVALKCLMGLGDPKAEARFTREIHALGRVDHPNLVKVFTSGSDGDRWFYAMELIEGADLAAVCAQLAGGAATSVSEEDWAAAVSTACERRKATEQPADAAEPVAEEPAALPTVGRPGRAHVARAVEVVRQAAEAAHALHEAGVIHRDIKPGNILLTADGGHAVLADLGLAQLADESEGRLTRTRQFVGTLRYASPEQMLAAKLDRRADIYSLGATLWELLTLRPLYGATDQTPTPELMLKIQTTDPERVRKHNPRVPADLEAIVARCLEKDRGRRYATAAELAADLGRWQRGEPVQAQPPSLSYLLRKQVRRYRGPLTAAAAMLLVLAAVVVVAFALLLTAWDKAQKNYETADKNGKALQGALNEKQQTLDSLNKQLSVSARIAAGRSDAEYRAGNLRDSLNWMLRAYEVAPREDSLRPSYVRLIGGRGRGLSDLALWHDGPVWSALFSPDGRTIVTASDDKSARLWDAASGQELQRLTHGAQVWSASFSPDGRTVVTASLDKTARLWDAASGKELQQLPHEGAVWSASFSPDGRMVVTVSEDHTARLWDAASGKELQRLTHGAQVWSASFSPNGRTVVTASEDKTARLWDATIGKELQRLTHEDQVWSASFSPDGRTIATASEDHTARLWDAASGKELQRLTHDDGVWSASFSPDGRTIATASEDHTARLWDAASGKELQRLTHDDGVWSASFSPDGRTVVTATTHKTARLWDAASGRELQRLTHEDWVYAASFSPDGRTIVTVGEEKTVRLWDAANGQELQRLMHEDEVAAAAFSPDGRTVLTVSDDKTVRLWDPVRGKELQRLTLDDRVDAAAFSPDGRTVVTASKDQTARLWDAASGKELQRLTHEKWVRAASFSPDGRTVVTASEDKTARLWDVASGQELQRLTHDDKVRAASFSPDGRTVVTASRDHTARLWDAASGKVLQRLTHEDQVRAAAFSPDGRTVVTGSDDKTARLWDAASGKELQCLRHEDLVLAASFSPDGRTVVTASEDHTARLWDAARGKELQRLTHEGPVFAAAFSPDGRTVVTASRDHTARLWDAASGKELQRLTHEGPVFAAAFSPDGRTVVTASRDHTARLWGIDFLSVPDDVDPNRLRAWVLAPNGFCGRNA